jgi:protein TonB
MTFPDDAGTHDPPERPAYRVPIGIPVRDEGRRQGAIVSVLIHAAIIALLLMPIVFAHTVIARIDQGAGGAGPAGGGGGGSGQGARETLRFIRVTRAPVPTPTKLPPVPVPVVPKIQPPLPPVPPVKAPEAATAPASTATVASIGDGTGSGRDGTAGNGPGSGGGVGSGIGPGRGSGVGPGTGGGTQANYPPSPIEIFLPPLPVPASVKGFKLTVEADVDSTGRVLDIKFTESRDGDFNRRIASILHSMRFRPGTRPDGTPLRMKAVFGWDF